MMILAICDPMAGILGINLQQYNNKIKIFNWKLQKTWLGSLSFFLSCFFVTLIALYFNQMNLGVKIFAYAFIISLAGTLADMLAFGCSWIRSDRADLDRYALS
jgi:dolichol kinase